MQISQWIDYLDRLVWGPWLLVLLLGTGCYLMIKLKFLPLKNLGKALKYAFGGGTAGEKKREKGQVSSFSSLTTELAATIGTGNIVGVTTAMVLGGPGALVWMMLSAVIGMATKLVESTL
ncbi:MAG: sodium:alanine symporter family protein, partial [Lachnospiraceae bacterium]|nr:sodium:alanine symporter family protein [Lachnospiraceae bacterium]